MIANSKPLSLITYFFRNKSLPDHHVMADGEAGGKRCGNGQVETEIDVLHPSLTVPCYSRGKPLENGALFQCTQSTPNLYVKIIV